MPIPSTQPEPAEGDETVDTSPANEGVSAQEPAEGADDAPAGGPGSVRG